MYSYPVVSLKQPGHESTTAGAYSLLIFIRKVLVYIFMKWLHFVPSTTDYIVLFLPIENTSCEPNPTDIEHSTELSLLPVKMENINPIIDNNNDNNNNGRIKSTCYLKKLKRKNLKMSKSLCYKNKLRNTVNSNSTHNEILYNGITPSLDDSIESNKSVISYY